MKNRLLIIGAGGHGKVIADIAMNMNKWNSISFLDDNEMIENCMGLNVVDKSANASKYINEADFFVAIGNNIIRETIQIRLETEGASIATIIHPNAIIGRDVVLGLGTVVMAGVVINCSTNIGKGCIINTRASLDHDVEIDEYVHISPGTTLAGGVMVSRYSWLGIGSVVSNNISITSNCTIGAGAVVVKDLLESGIYVGVPARRIRYGKDTNIGK